MTAAGTAAPRSGKRIGKYVITGRIGRGGMGMVYRGYDEVLERDVAVKTLTSEGTLDEESRKRFEIEAKAAAKLQHPNIVTVFELGEDRGIPFIAMELLPGLDLESLLRSGETLLVQEKLETVVQVCRGLAYAHEHRVIHRDVKPSNIRILDDGTAKIMDFGIAKLGATQVTKSGMMVGTIHYMSPEQILAKPLDGRSDVFSVGVILYELLEGKRPFTGDAATEILYKIVHGPTPAMTADLGPSSARLHKIVETALAKEPDRRYASASRLADDLAEVVMAHTRAVSGAISPETAEAVSASRRLLKEGRIEESVSRLKELTASTPGSLEVRRALRSATRELRRRQEPPAAEPDDFPELALTFQVPPTRRDEAETLLQPTLLRPVAGDSASVSAAPPPSGPAEPARTLAWAGGVEMDVALGDRGLLLTRDTPSVPAAGSPAPSAPPAAAVLTAPAPAPVEAVAAALTILKVVSDPEGATVALDGRRLDGATPMTLQIDAGSDHTLTVGAEGHATAEVRLSPGRVPPEVRVTLQPAGPSGQVQVSSFYPVDVLWKGKVVAKAQPSPRFSLPAGRQTVTLVSSTYFLRLEVPVQVRGGGVAAVDAPPLGKLNIRANPDNCEVFVDGNFADYPPILDRAVAAGMHTVAFKWPDGTRREEAVEVSRGAHAYVMGRKE